MISRVAETCFWQFRYAERANSTARLLRVHSGLVLDAALPPERMWRPLLIVLGEEPAYLERMGESRTADGDAVLEYLTWDPDSPVSIVSSLRWAREGARTIRETVSLEMWETLNAAWIWVTRGSGRRLYKREPSAFYEEVTRHIHQFIGACQGTMLHEEPFDFMRLGLNLERASQTARILDLQYHALGSEVEGPESAVRAAEWIAILRACAAYEPFFKKRSASLSGHAVAEFLLQEPAFPGSVVHALDRARNFLRRIRDADIEEPEAPEAGPSPSLELLTRFLEDVRRLDVREAIREGIHGSLTAIVDRSAEVAEAVRGEYFDQKLPTAGDAVRTSAPPPSAPRKDADA